MFKLLIWAIYGLVAGVLAKKFHPGEEKEFSGCLPTITIGVVGSFCGGLLNYLLGWGDDPISSSGFFMSVLGSLVFLHLYYLAKDKLGN